MPSYAHFRCKRCDTTWAVAPSLGLKGRPRCRGCGHKTTSLGGVDKRRRPRAKIYTPPRTDLRTRPDPRRLAALQAAAAAEKARLDALLGDESEEDSDEGDDDNYEPAARNFNIGMRLSAHGYAVPAVYPPCDATFVRAYGPRTIAGAAGRLNLNQLMGRHLNGGRVLSAWQHHGSTRWTQATKHASSEWCHLVADSLGGPSVADNIVAASFGANTWMAVVEKMLMGHTELQVHAVASCSAENCAEYIDYRISHLRSAGTIDRRINARAAGFSRQDKAQLEREIRRDAQRLWGVRLG